jgi:hypothetical protein
MSKRRRRATRLMLDIHFMAREKEGWRCMQAGAELAVLDDRDAA